MRGLPGSGKSTLARDIIANMFPSRRHAYASSDDFFMVNGRYRFDATKLSESHSYSFGTALGAMIDRACDLVVVDNTNITRAEYTPYVAVGKLYGYKTFLIHVDAPVELCVERNTHGVPAAVIERMARNFEKPAPHDPQHFTVAAVV